MVKRNQKNELEGPKANKLLKWQVKSKKYYMKDKYTMLLEVYWKWHCQHKGNNWEEFNAWIIKNYLLNAIRPVREMEVIKIMLVNIKGNFKKQTADWKDNWQILVKADNQKLLPPE